MNDSLDDAKELARLLRSIPAKVNLIPFNAVPGISYECSSMNAVNRFRDELVLRGLTTITRRPRGADIAAACGQLAWASPGSNASELPAGRSRMIRVMGVVAQLLLAGCASLMPDDTAERAEQRVEVYTQLGLGYMSQNRLATAQESLDEALAVNPKYSPANHAMALLMLRLGDPAGADKYFVSALES